MKVLARAGVSLEVLTEAGSTSKLTYMVSKMMPFLWGCWIEGLSS